MALKVMFGLLFGKVLHFGGVANAVYGLTTIQGAISLIDVVWTPA